MANRKKKTFTYNQAYSRGAQIAQDLQRSVAQRSADYAAPYVEGSMGAYTDVSDINNMTFIDAEIKKRLTEKKIRYYRQLAAPVLPNDQVPK